MEHIMADYIDNGIGLESTSANDIDHFAPFVSTHSLDGDECVKLINRENVNCLFALPKPKKSDQQNSKEKRQLVSATALCFAFMLAEIVGGYLAGSLAIMSDAAHLLSDCISFIVALTAIGLANKSSDNCMTFGYKRIEVLGAIISVMGIWLLTAFLFYFAADRLFYREFEIDADTMIVVSLVGILINIVMASILHGDGFWCLSHSHDKHRHFSTCSASHSDHDHDNNENRSKYKPLINEKFDCLPSKCDDIKIEFNHTIIGANDKKSFGCVFDGSTICPIHNYVHRDSSENTPVSSDTDDHHAHHRHHNHHNHQHNNHRNHSMHRHKNGFGIQHCGGKPHNENGHNLSHKNINIQAAVIHVIGDFIQSIGVFISAIVIKYYPNAKIVDPLCTFIFSLIVITTTCSIMKDSINIILEAVPNNINIEQLLNDLKCIDGVRSVHNLNVWSLTIGHNLLSAHIITDPLVNSAEVLYNATSLASERYNILQCTIQIESFSNNSEPMNARSSVKQPTLSELN